MTANTTAAKDVTPYTQEFYNNQSSTSLQSAQIVVPVVRQFINPASVTDIGCGVGTWLSVWQQTGTTQIHGFDGDYVQPAQLQIPQENFTAHDLSQPLASQLLSDKRCDLVMSLEVAEHLPEASAADFVKTLTSLSDVVLFSAALPYQGGVGHINEQWPSYWAEKFKNEGYVAIDCIRPLIWSNTSVCWWYCQNILMFAKAEKLSQYPELAKAHLLTNQGYLNKVHPRKYAPVARPKKKSLFKKLFAKKS